MSLIRMHAQVEASNPSLSLLDAQPLGDDPSAGELQGQIESTEAECASLESELRSLRELRDATVRDYILCFVSAAPLSVLLVGLTPHPAQAARTSTASANTETSGPSNIENTIRSPRSFRTIQAGTRTGSCLDDPSLALAASSATTSQQNSLSGPIGPSPDADYLSLPVALDLHPTDTFRWRSSR